MKWIPIVLVKIYQWTLGPVICFFNGGESVCRHDPTCSHYSIEALKVHGAFKGSWLTVKRIARCHPWGTFGPDPVPPKKDKRES